MSKLHNNARLTNAAGTIINPATEDTVSQLVMAINNAIDETAYDLNAAAFSETTNIANDYILDNVEFNFTTAASRNITITTVDGTQVYNATGNTDTHLVVRNFDMGFVGGENLTVAVSQTGSACVMDCILKVRSGTNSLLGNPHVGWIDTSGTEFGFQRAGSGRPRISVTDYGHDIAAGNISGHIPLVGLGENSSMPTPTGGIGVDIWEGPTDVIPHPPVAGEQMSVVSTSAQDSATGTGKATIRIEYIDGNGDAQTEDINLNGTTPVDTAATDIAFINHMFCTSSGSSSTSHVAAGDITIYKKAAPNTVYNIIKAGGNKDLTIAIRIPAGKTYFLNEWHCAVAGNKPTAIRLRSTDWSGILYNGDSPTFIFKDTSPLGESNLDRNFSPPLKIPGGSTIKVSGWATQADAFVGASFGGFYE